jgi:chlorobactene glucosyltransferase
LTFLKYKQIKPILLVDSFSKALPSLTVIVPARNESSAIERCLRGLLKQNYPSLEIVLVNDGSQDDTVVIACRVAADDSRLTILDATPTPEGWKGKTNACWQGAQAAKGEWLCFIDADTTPLSPASLQSAVLFSLERSLDLLSCQPFQELGTFWERIIYPTGFLLLLLSLDIPAINDPRKRDAAANGQFILIRRAVYQAVEGHANEHVRAKFVEDIALAKVVKGKGYKIALAQGDTIVSTRMYVGLKAMWAGFSRIVFEVFDSLLGSSIAATGALMIGIAPMILFTLGWLYADVVTLGISSIVSSETSSGEDGSMLANQGNSSA